MRIGIDIDGVLAQFNDAFILRVIQVTNKDLFPARPFDILTWHYAQSYGYTDTEVSAVWESIKADKYFWQRLGPYDTAEADLDALYDCQEAGHEIYFITARPGIWVKRQTEIWIQTHGYYIRFRIPTVLISSHKGLCAQALNLDAYIDDKDENVMDVLTRSFGKTKTFVMDRPWNQNVERHGGVYGMTPIRVSSVSQMLALLHP